MFIKSTELNLPQIRGQFENFFCKSLYTINFDAKVNHLRENAVTPGSDGNSQAHISITVEAAASFSHVAHNITLH